MTSGRVVCGALGHDAAARAAALASAAGDPARCLDHPRLQVHGSGPGTVEPSGTHRLAWASSPLPIGHHLRPTEELVRHDVSAAEVLADGTARLLGGVSGARPVYVEVTGGTVRFATTVAPLAHTSAQPLRPDWDAWAAILAFGGPLRGRTPFDRIRRLGPGARVSVPTGGDPSVVAPTLAWLAVEPDGRGTRDAVDAVRDALRTTVRDLAAVNHLAPLLSGGWDSRILATLASEARPTDRPTAWTTSSDIGTVLEELVAAEVADVLGLTHRIVRPRFDAFVDDARWYARAVDHQSSFHVWIAPLARALADTDATVLDGLGGGIFLGGAFVEDHGPGDVVDRRFARMARYLDRAERIVRPEVARQLRERTRADFETVVRPVTSHPDARAFTAYLTRTVPGIGLGPYGAIAATASVATPFLADAVVRNALRIDPAARLDGALYRPLLAPLAPDLAALRTAAERSGRQRHRPRRVSSVIAAGWYRGLLTNGPVGDLLAPSLRNAALPVWQRQLGRTRGQHLIRSLATLALWLEEHQGRLGTGVDALLEPTG